MCLFTGSTMSGLTPTAYSLECSLEISADTIPLCRQGGAERHRSGVKRWSVTTQELCDYMGGILPVERLVGQPLCVGISVLQRDIVEAGIKVESPDPIITLVGVVIVSSIRLSGAVAGMTTKSLSYIGSGELGILAERNGFPYIIPLAL